MNEYILALFFCLISIQLKSQDTLFTDRPTATISAKTLQKGWFQFETGFRYESQDLSSLGSSLADHQLELINWNETLLRFGLTQDLELRFGQFIRQYKYRESTTLENELLEFAPTSVGLKWSFLKSRSTFPEMSVLFNLSGPLLAKGDYWTAETKLLFSSPLFKNFELNYNFGYHLVANSHVNFIDYSVALSRSLNQSWNAFVESFGTFAQNKLERHNFDLGLTYLISNTLQADAYFGGGFNDNSAQLIFGFGLSKLFLPKQ